MEYRALGKTGIQISAIGIGCWEIGGGYGSIEETEFIKAVNRALDLGINCFDTAEAYGFGASEVSLAKFIDGVQEDRAKNVTQSTENEPREAA
jgi:aryl-alcohol dehydrogenase-like predicted oxidoreductase